MSCLNCMEIAELINEDLLCLKCFNDDKYEPSETDGYAETIDLCIRCGNNEDDLIDNMYCLDCWKRQRFLCIFRKSATYDFGAYFGKHLLEKYLGYYITENNFIEFMKRHDFIFDKKTETFRTKINKKKALEILGVKL